MKAMMSVVFAMIMAFALVSIGEAGTGSSCNFNAGAISAAHNTPVGVGVRDADRAGNIIEGTQFPCIGSPAYTDYADARAVPCPMGGHDRRVPEPMGSPGY